MAPSPVVRDAAAADLQRCAATLAASHRDHPWDRWALTGSADAPVAGDPDPDDVEGRLRRLIDVWFRLSVLPSGHGRVVDDGYSVAVWVPSDVAPLPPDVADGLDAVADEILGSRASVVAEVEASVRSHRPSEPHVVLATLGTDPMHQGRGLAGALLENELARLDDRGVVCALETSRDENVAFYQRFGFEVTADLPDPGHGCPPTWVMARQPC